MVQLHLVDAELEKNPVTPERRKPIEARTPPPPLYFLGTSLPIRKDWAMRVAAGLKQLHAGRVMLKKEEAERREDLEGEPDYWDLKADQWQDFGWNLYKRVG